MSNQKHSIFKTPQKSTNVLQNSPPLKLQNRYRSPLANIQNVSSKLTSCQFTSSTSMCITSHNHGTPPRSFFKIKNPFEKHLIDNLHTPICSPGMFKIRESETGTFKWDIEHVSILKPADIEPCNSQFDPSPDPQLEEKATKAIERFFSQETIVPSPMDEAPKRNILLPMDSKDEHTTPEGTKSVTREVWTQTALTLPMDLPPEVENTLKAFCTFSKQEQIGVGEADLSANASLRRKLCFEEIYSDVEEEEIHMSIHNLSCPTFDSPQVNPMARGFRRNFDTPQSKDKVDNNKEVISTPRSGKMVEEELNDFSPIVKLEMKKRHSNEENISLQSPSMSPIQEQSNVVSSPKQCDSVHHSCDASPFSQSTPEKSIASKSSNKSSPDTSDNSDVPVQYRRNVNNVKYFKFTDDMCNIVRDETKIETRSKSELSVASLGRSKSAMKLDFSMDVSSENSDNFCADHSNITGGTEPNSPTEAIGTNYWDLEMAQFVVNTKNSQNVKCDKCNVSCDVGGDICDNFIKENLCDCQGAMEDRLEDVYQYLTPTKCKDAKVIHDEGHLNKTYSSPMQTSPSHCIPTNTNRSELFGSHFNFNYSRSLDENCSSSNALLTSNILSGSVKNSSTFKRQDSGFNECTGISNISNINSQNSTLQGSISKHIDSTKSFIVNNETSNVSWRRFDSGFNEETSSDFSHHASNETSKHTFKKYSPIQENSENKENIYFEPLHNKHCEMTLPYDAMSMSVSDIFPEDSFACNFSSTPSQSKYYSK